MLKIENKALYVVDNAIDADLNEQLYRWALASGRPGWRYGDVADAKYSKNRFWGATLVSADSEDGDPKTVDEAEEIVRKAWAHLEPRLKPFTFDIRDIWLNGQTYGLENAIHTDRPSEEEGWYTVLIYINPEWHVDWGGETMFYNQARTDVVYAVVPKPGRLVFFDARHHHWARPPTRNTQDLRITLAFHLTRRSDSPVP